MADDFSYFSFDWSLFFCICNFSPPWTQRKNKASDHPAILLFASNAMHWNYAKFYLIKTTRTFSFFFLDVFYWTHWVCFSYTKFIHQSSFLEKSISYNSFSVLVHYCGNPCRYHYLQRTFWLFVLDWNHAGKCWASTKAPFQIMSQRRYFLENRWFIWLLFCRTAYIFYQHTKIFWILVFVGQEKNIWI